MLFRVAQLLKRCIGKVGELKGKGGGGGQNMKDVMTKEKELRPNEKKDIFLFFTFSLHSGF